MWLEVGQDVPAYAEAQGLNPNPKSIAAAFEFAHDSIMRKKDGGHGLTTKWDEFFPHRHFSAVSFQLSSICAFRFAGLLLP